MAPKEKKMKYSAHEESRNRIMAIMPRGRLGQAIYVETDNHGRDLCDWSWAACCYDNHIYLFRLEEGDKVFFTFFNATKDIRSLEKIVQDENLLNDGTEITGNLNSPEPIESLQVLCQHLYCACENRQEDCWNEVFGLEAFLAIHR
jgi:hypothetical protein